MLLIAQKGHCVFEEGTNYPQGNIFGHEPSPGILTAEECCDLCSLVSSCVVFSLAKSTGECYLKSNITSSTSDTEMISGRIREFDSVCIFTVQHSRSD